MHQLFVVLKNLLNIISSMNWRLLRLQQELDNVNKNRNMSTVCQIKTKPFFSHFEQFIVEQ